MNKPKREPPQSPPTVANHRPLYWFGLLVQAMADGNDNGRFQAQSELRSLGFDIRIHTPLEVAGGSRQ